MSTPVGWEYRHPGYLTNRAQETSVSGMAKREVVEYTEEFLGWGSSSIDHVWFNGNTQRMTVRFKSGGLYSYDGVDDTLFDDFQQADSLGNFFREHFRTTPPWPGAKHDERLVTFTLVEVETPVRPDLDALKAELITTGKGKTWHIDFTYSGRGKMDVRAPSWQEAMDVLEKRMEELGFSVEIEGISG